MKLAYQLSFAMKTHYLFTIIFFLFLCYLPLSVISQTLNHKINQRENTLLILKQTNSIKSTLLQSEILNKILFAQKLHENGERMEALNQLKSIIVSNLLNQPQNIILKAEAYSCLAECYYGMNMIEKYRTISDNLLQLNKYYSIDLKYKTRALINLAMILIYCFLKNCSPFLNSFKHFNILNI